MATATVNTDKSVSSLAEDIDDITCNFVEAWHRFQPLRDLLVIEEFVANEYNEAKKTTHIDFGNTIILSLKLKNGYVIVEHCICRDPAKFDLVKGLNLCKEKVLKRLLEIYEPVESKSYRR